MKTRLCLVLGITAVLGLLSCEEDKIISNTQLVKSVNVTSQDFQDGDAGTRATYTVDDGGFHFTWSAGDTVGIYPVGGDQVAFPISSGEGSKTAQFDGGAWALRSSYSYAAYYPFSSVNYHVDETSVPVSYIGQSQNGNGSLDCLDRYDYQASVATRPDAEGNVNIELKHLGCFVRFQLSMPVPDTYTSVTLKSNKSNLITSGSFDLSQGSITLTPQETAQSISISLNNDSTTADNKVLTVYCMMAPSDLSNSEISITVEGTLYKSYTATVSGKKMLAGKAYGYTAKVQSGTNINGSDVEWDDEGQETSPTANIIFADENVKALCVSNWDTDGDGNLSIAEAAAVTNIGSVFKGKKIKSFKELRFFTGLTTIPYYAFQYCRDLTSIELPNSVTAIRDYAFYNCSGLTSIELPSSVTYIGEYAFYNCSGLTSIELPNSVTSIWNYTFSYCRGLTSIELPDSLTSIGDYAFCECSSLTSIEIPNSVTSIGDYAFAFYDWCYSLISIELPNNLTSIGYGTFYNCSGLTSIEIPNSVASIGSSAFYNCTGLTSIVIPDSVISIGSRAFYNCSGLTSIVIPSNVENIGGDCFGGCSGLESIIVASDNEVYDSRNNCNAIIRKNDNTIISGCKNTIIPSSVTSIGKYAFSHCSGLTSIEIPTNITSIEEKAFEYCRDLTSLVFPEGSSVSIEREAFEECRNLTSIEFPKEGSISIGEIAFIYCKGLDSIYFSDGVKTIGHAAFEDCYLTSIVISSGVTSIAEGAFFDGDELYSITVAEGNPVYDSRNNCNAIIETQSNTLIVGCNNTVIPNSVTSIGDYAFQSCIPMTSIDIPNSVVSIGDYAFRGTGLTSITIPESVKTIGDEAFSYKYYLTDVYCYAKNIPETGRDVFDELELPVTLHVPEEAIELYKATEPWKNFDAIVPLEASDSEPEYVDLGLSVKWATFNVGATRPEEYGDYFAWGETETKTDYTLSTYKYCNGSDTALTKYCNKSYYGNNGFTDTKTTLDPEDDVAHVKWGGDWRMPTQADFNELRNNCDWSWVTQNGVNGWKVTSRKNSSRSIFLPAAGCRFDTILDYVGSVGFYWSSSLYTDNPDYAWYLGFFDDHYTTYYYRYYGRSVRPVCP